VAVFFIDTSSGQVATQRQLVEAGVASADGDVGPPWHRIQGTNDASTMWYAVMRKRTRGVYIGALVLRHGGQHASLLEAEWEEVPVQAIGVDRGGSP
jgi:hypothetical protein